MFKFNELSQIHLEITNNCQASCPMCNRNINGGLENPLIKIRSWSLEDFKIIMSNEVLQQLDSYYFCSNFGDPALNNDLIKMCTHSKVVAPTVRIVIHTNGGLRSTEWWQTLAQALPVDHSVVFALDGLEDTHHLYRVGTKFDTVLKNAQAFMAAGGKAEWAFIKFKHNEHQVDAARKLSGQYGFKNFILKNSSRFILEPKVDVVDRNGTYTHCIEPSSDTTMKFIDKKVIHAYAEIIKDSVIDCKVLQNKEVYIDAHGDLYPCCWIASVPYSFIDQDDAYEIRNKMLIQHKELMSKLGEVNALRRSVKDIINSNEYQSVWADAWGTNKLITCARTCGTSSVKFAQPKDQIISE